MSYITTDDLQVFLSASSLVDDDADRACAGAARWVDGYCRRTFELATEPSARLFPVIQADRLYVDDIATDVDLTVGDGVDYGSEWATTDYLLEPLTPTTGWPYTSIRTIGARYFTAATPGLVQVTATWGWPAVPEDVQYAALIQAAKLYKRRESAEGVLGAGEFGIVRVGTRVDPDVAALLEPYRNPSFGIA